MFLPNKLPNRVVRTVAADWRESDNNNNNNAAADDGSTTAAAVDHHHRHNQSSSSSSSALAAAAHRMGGRGKKAADRDQMLGPASPIHQQQQQQQQPSTSFAAAAHSGGGGEGFVARSWARISGRRRRQKRRRQQQMIAEEEEEQMRRRDQRVATTMTVVDGVVAGGGVGQQQQQQQQPGMIGTEMFAPQQRGNNSWMVSAADRNLSGLAHLVEDQQRGDARTGGEEEARKRHFLGRGMDRLRRSIRRTLHRGSNGGGGSSKSGQAHQALTHPAAADGGGAGSQPCASSSSTTAAAPNGGPAGTGLLSTTTKSYCHSDEIAVRSSACSFPVKYLGSCEVFESRGMSVCESALQHLRTRKRATKAFLYVSGDGIRVVDQENNRGLIVDQTIEKVSFCSPDRHNDHGFAYICRDGATRRWMCHGFYSIKDSGERLSHAVGCAFTVCLEKKRKRDAETAAHRNAQTLAAANAFDGGNLQQQKNAQKVPLMEGQEQFARTNQAYKSFRQLSISERRADPQKAILVVDNASNSMQSPISGNGGPIRPQSAMDLSLVNNSFANIQNGFSSTTATPRPAPNPTLFQRTGSLRAPLISTTHHHHPPPHEVVPPVPGPKPTTTTNAPFNNQQRFHSLGDGGANANENGGTTRMSMPRMSFHNEPIWEGKDDGGGGGGTNGKWAELLAGNVAGVQENAKWHAGGGGIGENPRHNRFYRTLPHSLPNFGGQGTNCWTTTMSSVIPPPIPEEEKSPQPAAEQMPQHNFGGGADERRLNAMNSNSPPADPFTTESAGEGADKFVKVRADDWLEQTFKRASLHYPPPPTLLSRSATMNWPPVVEAEQQQSWAQFPQSQLGDGHQDWTDSFANSAIAQQTPRTTTTNCAPPSQPPPPLPPTSTPSIKGEQQHNRTTNSSSAQQQSSLPPTAVTSSGLQTPAIGNVATQLPTLSENAAVDKQQQNKQQSSSEMTAFNKNHAKKPSASRRIEYQLLQEIDVSLSPPSAGESLLAKTYGGRATKDNDNSRNVISGSEAAGNGNGEESGAIDPFDVHWSQKVLADTAKQRSNNNNKQQQQQTARNDLMAKMAPPSIGSTSSASTTAGNGGGTGGSDAHGNGTHTVAANPFGWDMAPSASVNV